MRTSSTTANSTPPSSPPRPNGSRATADISPTHEESTSRRSSLGAIFSHRSTNASPGGEGSASSYEDTHILRGSLGNIISQLASHAEAVGTPSVEEPPMPLHVDAEPVRTFEMGPRMSSNYHSVGISVGASLNAAGVPLGGTVMFESSGGTGALMVARNPIQRHLLRHEGVLKAYLKAHRRYIFDTYGHAEDVKIDELMLVYGQDCTTDWAVAVTIDSAVGSRVEFEIFAAAKAGLWGGWKTNCSASQRGPYRGGSSSSAGDDSGDPVQPMMQLDRDPADVPSATGSSGDDAQPQFDVKTDLGVGDNTFSLNFSGNPSKGGPSNGKMPMPQMPDKWTWDKRDDAELVNQTIVLRRITAKSRFAFPTIMHASAGPRTDGQGGSGRKDAESDRLKATWDPIDVVHRYILRNTDNSVWCSIASDDDAVRLVRAALREMGMVKTPLQDMDIAMLEAHMCVIAGQLFTIHMDCDGTAMLEPRARPISSSLGEREVQRQHRGFAVPSPPHRSLKRGHEFTGSIHGSLYESSTDSSFRLVHAI